MELIPYVTIIILNAFIVTKIYESLKFRGKFDRTQNEVESRRRGSEVSIRLDLDSALLHSRMSRPRARFTVFSKSQPLFCLCSFFSQLGDSYSTNKCSTNKRALLLYFHSFHNSITNVVPKHIVPTNAVPTNGLFLLNFCSYHNPMTNTYYRQTSVTWWLPRLFFNNRPFTRVTICQSTFKFFDQILKTFKNKLKT